MPKLSHELSSGGVRPRVVRRWRLAAVGVALALVGGLSSGVVSAPMAVAAPGVGLFSDTLRPTVAAVTSSASVNLGVRFSSSQDGMISEVQFYRGTQQLGAYKASLWNSAGKLLARTTFPASSVVGWQTVGLGKTVRIQAQQSYVLSYLASDGRYPVTSNAFNTAYHSNGLTVPANGGLSTAKRDNELPLAPESNNYMLDVLFLPLGTPVSGSPSTAPSAPNSPTPSTTVHPPSTLTPTPTVRPSSTPIPTTTVRPTPTGTSSPGTIHGTPNAATVRAALGKRVFFGHQSIGGQVMKGVTAFTRQAGLGTPTYPDPTATSLPRTGGLFAQSHVGRNGQPFDKLADFDRILRSGVGSQIDVAVFKFCYADIRTRTNDPVAVFNAYRSTMSALERDFPNVTFIYATEPIVMAANSDAPNNIPRGVFNNLVRAEYGATGRIWDIAAIQSTTFDGTRVLGTYQGQTFEALNPAFAAPDQRHIYGAGETAAAGPLLELIAQAR